MSLATSLSYFFGNEQRRKSSDAAPGGNMRPLMDAAAGVLATMRRKGYALAAVAAYTRSEEQAVEWVAENMLAIVPVYEKDGSGWRRAERGPITGRNLAVPPASIDAYLKWAEHAY